MRSSRTLLLSDGERGFLLALATLFYAAYLGFMVWGLRFDMLRSDVLTYWTNSLNLQEALFSTWFVPGYPLLIAAVRSATLNLLPPLAIMVAISYISYLTAVCQVVNLGSEAGWPSWKAKQIALLFAIYPLVGLTYAVYPVADALAIALVSLSLVALYKRKWDTLAGYSAAAMIVHKVTWFFLPPLLFFAFVAYPSSRRRVVWAFVPVLLIAIMGTFRHGDILWMVRWSKEHLMTSQSQLPLFDGVFGSLIWGDLFDKAKGLIVLTILVWDCSILIWRGSKIQDWFAVIVGLSFIAMIAFVNQYEIWSAVRFSKILLLSSLAPLYTLRRRVDSFLESYKFLGLLAFSFGTNLLFGYYMAKVFFD